MDDLKSLLPHSPALLCRCPRLTRRERICPVKGTNSLAKAIQVADGLLSLNLDTPFLHSLAQPRREGHLTRQGFPLPDAFERLG